MHFYLVLTQIIHFQREKFGAVVTHQSHPTVVVQTRAGKLSHASVRTSGHRLRASAPVAPAPAADSPDGKRRL